MVFVLSTWPWPSPMATLEPRSRPEPHVGDRGLVRRDHSPRRPSRRAGHGGVRAGIEAGRWCEPFQIAQLLLHHLEGSVFPPPCKLVTDRQGRAEPAAKPQGKPPLVVPNGRAKGEGQAGRSENGHGHCRPADLHRPSHRLPRRSGSVSWTASRRAGPPSRFDDAMSDSPEDVRSHTGRRVRPVRA